MVKLRGHHLICLQFYRGEGYNKDFVENLEGVLKAAEDEGVEVTEGGDDVCRACPSCNGGICTHEPGGEEKIQSLDRLAMSLLGISENTLEWSEIKRKIPRVIGKWKKQACENCEWRVVCENDDAWNQD